MEPGLAAVDVAHLLAIEERIFLEPDTHPLTAPGRDVGRRVELDGKGRTGLQRIVTVSGHAALRVPHSDRGARPVTMKTDRVGIDRRFDALLDGLRTAGGENLVPRSTDAEVIR